MNFCQFRVDEDGFQVQASDRIGWSVFRTVGVISVGDTGGSLRFADFDGDSPLHVNEQYTFSETSTATPSIAVQILDEQGDYAKRILPLLKSV